MLDGNYSAALPVLRQAVNAASPGSLTYAYALYDYGRTLLLAGDPKDAVTVLYQRLQIPNQTGAVRQELQLALLALGQNAQSGGAGAAPPGTVTATEALAADRRPGGRPAPREPDRPARPATPRATESRTRLSCERVIDVLGGRAGACGARPAGRSAAPWRVAGTPPSAERAAALQCPPSDAPAATSAATAPATPRGRHRERRELRLHRQRGERRLGRLTAGVAL